MARTTKTRLRKGQRVGAIAHVEDGVLVLFGYGVYEGRYIPVGMPGLIARLAEAQRVKLPRFRLDSGETVWGFECFWAPARHVEKMEADAAATRYVSVETQRALLKNGTQRS